MKKSKVDLLRLEKEQAKLERLRGPIRMLFNVAVLGWTGFTATKIWDMVDASRPPDAAYLPYLAVFVISGGFLIWLGVMENVARNQTQRATAIAMALIAWLLELLLAIGDSVYRQTLFTLDMPTSMKWMVTVSPVVAVMVYLAGAAWFWWNDPDTRNRMGIIKAKALIQQARNESLLLRAEAESDNLGQMLANKDFNDLAASIVAEDRPSADEEVPPAAQGK